MGNRVQKCYPSYYIPYVRQDELESFPLGRKQTQLNVVAQLRLSDKYLEPCLDTTCFVQ